MARVLDGSEREDAARSYVAPEENLLVQHTGHVDMAHPRVIRRRDRYRTEQIAPDRFSTSPCARCAGIAFRLTLMRTKEPLLAL